MTTIIVIAVAASFIVGGIAGYTVGLIVSLRAILKAAGNLERKIGD